MRFLNRRRLSRDRFERIFASNNSRVKAAIAGRTKGIRRAARRNRVLLVTLIAVGVVVAALTGISLAQGSRGFWQLQVTGPQDPQPPAARFGAATTYDAANDDVLIFGGFVGSTSSPGTGIVTGPPILNDNKTWAYKPSTHKWINRNPRAPVPSPRGFAAMAYDGTRRNVVLFGGAPYRSNAVSGETWLWDGKDWTLADPPEPRPDPRQNAVMVYDVHRKVVVMYGGRGLNAAGTALVPLGDTWTWNGSAWKIMPSAGAPSPRHSAAMAYDVCRAEAVMFGGIGDPINSFAPQPGETWIWDGAKWIQKIPLLSPPRKVGASMAYSHGYGRVFLYGGFSAVETGQSVAGTETDVWMWDGATATGWEKMNSEVSNLESHACTALTLACSFLGIGHPPARAYTSFVPTATDNFSLFGGTPSADAGAILSFLNPVPQVALGDHFLFSSKSGFFVNGVSSTLFPLKCTNPVPIPEDGTTVGGQAGSDAPKVQAREGMREFGKLPVLVGTDWPSEKRNTHINASTPNPNYTPPPDCPNRIFEETGAQTHLTTDPKRNRVYQFFICDHERGQTPQSASLPRVYRLLIAAYDGTTLKQLNSVITPIRVEIRGYQTFLDDLLLHDADRGLFYVRSSYYNGSTTVTELVVIRQDLIEKGIDPVDGKIPLSGSISKMSFFNHPKTGRPQLLINRGGTTLSQAQVDFESNKVDVDWDATATGCATMGADVWTNNMRPMRSGNSVYNACSGSIQGSNRMGVVRIPITENADGSETPGTAEVFAGPFNVTANWGDPEAERMLLFSDTAYGKTLWVFDGKASRFVGRAGISSEPPGQGGVTAYGFDHKVGRFYYHMPDTQGQFGGYKYRVQGGLLVLDARLTPVPQVLNFSQFAAIQGARTIAALPAEPGIPRRAFIRRGEGNTKKYPDGETVKMQNEMFYTVVADEVPVPGETELAQLDALTIPIPESLGRTEVTFDAEGSGYGIRLRSIGGIWSILRPFAQIYAGGGEVVEGLLLDAPRPAIPGCIFPDRELMAGWIPQAHLSELDALARSSGLEVDSNSKTDLEGPFSRCNPTAGPANVPPSTRFVLDALWPLWQMIQLEGNKAASQGTTVETGKDADGQCGELKQSTPTGEVVISDCTETPAGAITRGKDAQGNPTVRYQSMTSSWDSHFKEVECVGDALKTYQANVGNIYGSANCVQTKGRVEATARGSATGAGPTSSIASSAGFSVAEGYSSVEVTREPNGKGVVVTSTAVAKGIQLPGASFGAGNLTSLSIDRVETKAVAWSNGRPGEERALFTRIICGVHDPEGKVPNGCLTTAQQQQLVDNWNARWGINSKMYLPKYDPDFYLGSPGGYIAGVIKPVADELEDQLFAKDFQREVSGLVIEFYKDSQAQGPARQTLQLAAVRAVAGLGVQCNPDYLYSPQKNDCLPIPDDILEEEFFEEDEEEFLEDEEELDGEWIPAEALEIPGESLGSKIGRLLDRLPVIRQLPIRQMGEALLAASVWVLLGLPMLFAWRRLSLNNA